MRIRRGADRFEDSLHLFGPLRLAGGLALFGDHFTRLFAADFPFQAGEDLAVGRVGVQNAESLVVARLGHFRLLLFKVGEELFGPFVFLGLVEEAGVVEGDHRALVRVALDRQDEVFLRFAVIFPFAADDPHVVIRGNEGIVDPVGGLAPADQLPVAALGFLVAVRPERGVSLLFQLVGGHRLERFVTLSVRLFGFEPFGERAALDDLQIRFRRGALLLLFSVLLEHELETVDQGPPSLRADRLPVLLRDGEPDIRLFQHALGGRREGDDPSRLLGLQERERTAQETDGGQTRADPKEPAAERAGYCLTVSGITRFHHYQPSLS